MIGKREGNRGQPSFHERRVLINHDRDEPDGWKGKGKSLMTPGGEGHQSLEQYQEARGVLPGGVLLGLLGPPQGNPARTGE